MVIGFKDIPLIIMKGIMETIALVLTMNVILVVPIFVFISSSSEPEEVDGVHPTIFPSHC